MDLASLGCVAPVECPVGVLCALGNLLDCPQGNYCPDPETKLVCPKGYWCPSGSTKPLVCPKNARCPEGSKVYAWPMVVVAVIIICSLLSLTRFLSHRLALWRAARRKQLSVTPSRDAAQAAGWSVPGQSTSPSAAFRVPFPCPVNLTSVSHTIPTRAGPSQVLCEVTARFYSGGMHALMGPSGCGKSTLLGVIGRSYKDVGFVPQDDVLLPTLTVWDTVAHAGRVKGAPTSSIRSVIAAVGLAGYEDRNVMALSGGQRKKVSVAVELVTQPAILLLDEPTSGLDSTSSMELVSLLKDLAVNSGLTVIAVLHQPRIEIVNLIDEVLVLRKGKSVYFGSMANLGQQIRVPPHTNPADHLMDIIDTMPVFVSHGPSSSRMPASHNGMRRSSTLNPKSHVIPSSMNSRPLATVLDEDELPGLVHSSSGSQGGGGAAAGGTGAGAGSSNALAVQSVSQSQIPESRSRSSLDPKSGSRDRLRSGDSAAGADAPLVASHNHITPPMFPILVWLYFRRSMLQMWYGLPAVFVNIVVQVIVSTSLGIAQMKEQRLQPPLPIEILPLCPDLIKDRCEFEAPNIDSMSIWVFFYVMVSTSAFALSGTSHFGEEITVWKRERLTGANSLAYFVGKNLSHLFPLLVEALAGLCTFILLASPRSALASLYLAVVTLGFAGHAVGYIVAFTARREAYFVVTIVSSVALSVFCGSYPPLDVIRENSASEFFWSLFFTRWSGEAFYLAEAHGLYEAIGERARVVTENRGYQWDNGPKALGLVIMFGFILRAIAFLRLWWIGRKAKAQNSA